MSVKYYNCNFNRNLVSIFNLLLNNWKTLHFLSLHIQLNDSQTYFIISLYIFLECSFYLYTLLSLKFHSQRALFTLSTTQVYLSPRCINTFSCKCSTILTPARVFFPHSILLSITLCSRHFHPPNHRDINLSTESNNYYKHHSKTRRKKEIINNLVIVSNFNERIIAHIV